MTYRYKSLSKERKEIRLVYVDAHPLKLSTKDSTSSDLVKCRLGHFPLVENPGYIALSYVWGDPRDTTTILLDGFPIQVTVNLAAALAHWQKTGATHGLWIDAICINQSLHEEKNWQIQLMHQIYATALHVYCWLGSESSNSRLATTSLSEYGNQLLQVGITVEKLIAWPNRDDEKSTIKIQSFCDRLTEEVKANPSGLTAIIELLQRPYWQRAWIFQEIISGQEVVLRCGEDAIVWPIFELAIHLFWNALPQLRSGQEWNRKPMIIGQYRDWQHSGNQKSLELLLRSTCHSLQSLQASDPRDKVYALLALACDAKEHEIKVDYSLPVSEVYSMTAVTLYRQGSDLLSCCQFPKGVRNLPSWAPDWSTPLRHSFEGMKIKTLYSACGDLKANSQVIERNGTRFLSIRALYLDEVEYLAPQWIRFDGLRNADHVWSASHWLADLFGHLSHVYGSTSTADCWKCIIADHELSSSSNYQRATQASFDSFQALQSVCLQAHIEPSVIENATFYLRRMTNTLGSYRFAMTKERRLSLVPRHAQLGDSVYIVAGENIPYLLRPDASAMELIGPAFVNGGMDGEALRDGLGLEEVVLS